MPGAGKSTVGVILAKRLGYDFIDTDLLLIKKAGRALPEILKSAGVDGFLELESAVGQSIKCDRTVIATGGSMVLLEAAMENLRNSGVVIWLDTELEDLERRISDKADRGIAARPGESLADIFKMRRPYYEKYSDIRIPCVAGTDNVVAMIRQALNYRGSGA